MQTIGAGMTDRAGRGRESTQRARRASRQGRPRGAAGSGAVVGQRCTTVWRTNEARAAAPPYPRAVSAGRQLISPHQRGDGAGAHGESSAAADARGGGPHSAWGDSRRGSGQAPLPGVQTGLERRAPRSEQGRSPKSARPAGLSGPPRGCEIPGTGSEGPGSAAGDGGAAGTVESSDREREDGGASAPRRTRRGQRAGPTRSRGNPRCALGP